MKEIKVLAALTAEEMKKLQKRLDKDAGSSIAGAESYRITMRRIRMIVAKF